MKFNVCNRQALIYLCLYVSLSLFRSLLWNPLVEKDLKGHLFKLFTSVSCLLWNIPKWESDISLNTSSDGKLIIQVTTIENSLKKLFFYMVKNMLAQSFYSLVIDPLVI